MADLPEEMLVDILIRLPVESLVRFKCVCKSWYALFKNLEFVSKHMANQSKKDIILKRECPENGTVLSFLSITNDGCENNVSCIVDLNLDLKLTVTHDSEYSLRVILHGHCDGLIALSDANEEIIICNPTIKEVRALPKSSFHPFSRYLAQYPDQDIPNPLNAETVGVGFGYDYKSKDYKVVRVVDFTPHESSSPFDLPSRVEVFSLNADSTWREINNAVFSEVSINAGLGDDMEQYFDGVYYWLIDSLEVLSFDMGDDVFRMAPMPDVCCPSWINNNLLKLGVFNNESIAMLVYHCEGFEKCIDVWAMKEFGSWTKQLTIGPLQALQCPLVFWKNGKELLHEDDDTQLVSLDLATLESKTLPIDGVRAFPYSWQAIPYMKTLVSVNRREDVVTA